VNRHAFILVSLLAVCGAPSQQPASVDDLFQSVEEWVRGNLDDTVRQALQNIDQERALALLDQLLQRLQKENIYDLATLKQGVLGLVPLLDQFEETQPYSIWLRTRLDYLDAAEQLRRELPPAPPPKKGVPAPLTVPRPAPPLQLQRSVWTKQLEKRPLPPRAQAYVPKLKPIFLAEKVPAELVWLAEVESSFEPRAKSPSGAAGLFQLMRPTAKTLGLSTWFPDERLNPEKSARATAKYLHHLHERFGDWRLALAAYNAGEGRVNELLKKSKTRSFDAIASRLPSETQLYVPKVEATVRKREGRALAELKMPKG
jgi:membrane-bound lytic murein transglycosylase D